jgi:hypothetical protein
MLTAEDIALGKASTAYSHKDVYHESDDSIRIAYEWLDAQKRTRSATRKFRPLKHIIENWGGRYVSQSDVEVAAHMHPEIFGSYPYFNFSSKLTLPSESRLDGVEQSKTQSYTTRNSDITYSLAEPATHLRV